MITEKDLVEDPNDKVITTARNLPDSANSDDSLEGYAAINGLDEQAEIARRAYELYQQRGEQHGHADGDWFRAEEEVRRLRNVDFRE